MAASAPVWAFDYAEDFLIVDGLETVNLLRQNSDGTFAAPVEVRAVREMPNKKTAAGLMEAADIIFHLYQPDVGEEGVRPLDQIQDAAEETWSVNSAALGGILDQWRCPATKAPE